MLLAFGSLFFGNSHLHGFSPSLNTLGQKVSMASLSRILILGLWSLITSFVLKFSSAVHGFLEFRKL